MSDILQDLKDKLKITRRGFEDMLWIRSIKEIDRLRTELAAKDARIATLEDAADEDAGTVFGLRADNEALRKELATTKEAHERTAEKLTNYIGAVSYEMDVTAALRKELAEAKAALDKLQKAYDESHNENRDLLQFIERMEQEIDRA